MYLLIVEVSGKQAYIFRSLRLRDNVHNSENIARAVSEEYFKDIEGYSEYNLVYSGGGHTVLVFDKKEQAVEFARKLTYRAMRNFDGMEIFAKVMEYDEKKTPGENVSELCRQLEIKKSIRRNAFRRKTYGIERIETEENRKFRDYESYNDKYCLARTLEELGGTESDKNFIAVVHIDGNSMGKRVNSLRNRRDMSDWKNFKTQSDKFSKDIDESFKDAFKEMVQIVIDNIESKRLEKNGLSLKLKEGKFILPIRKLILAGDDVCFVCDGRIGLECADIFMQKLREKTNGVDDKAYYAAAGVCIVHSKFPFHRAYDMAESLCTSAKKLIADSNIEGCAIDWHIEQGELESTMGLVKGNYIVNADNEKINLLLRPYFCGTDDIKSYENFRCITEELSEKFSGIPRSKIKGLRDVFRKGRKAVNYFIVTNRINSILTGPINSIDDKRGIILNRLENIADKKGIFIEDEDEIKCLIFDAIEAMDLFIPLER